MEKTIEETFNAAERILDIYLRLEKDGQTSEELARDYGKSKDTIYRDIRSIQKVLEKDGDSLNLIFNRKEERYELNRGGNSLTFAEVAAIMITLYCSRSFNKDEMRNMEEKIIRLFKGNERNKLYIALK